MSRCFEPVRIRTCLLLSGILFSLISAIFVIFARSHNFLTWEPLATLHVATNSTHNSQAKLDSNGDRVVLFRQPVVTKINTLNENALHKYVNIFNASDENEEERNSVNANKCVPLRTTMGNTPICIYDPKIDKWVSGSIVKGGMWDRVGVQLMASFLKENPDMQVMDIGSNIGVFTLQAAKMSRRVMAVDANKFNVRLLAKSLRLGELQKNVTLVWNAITDIHETVNLTITTGNIGGSFVKSAGEVSSPTNSKFNKRTALAVTLENLVGFVKGFPIFMKIDIERSEWRAFWGGEIFFQEVDVRYILMEWWTYKKESNGREVIRFMTRFGFQPYPVISPLQKKLNVDKYDTWPGDVLWVKN